MALAVFLTWTATTRADADRDAKTVSLEEAAAIAVREHYDMQSARLAVEQARGRARQAARIENPELELSGSSNEPVGGAGESSWSVGLYQPLATPRGRALEKRIGQLDIERAQDVLRDAGRRMIERVYGQYIRAAAGRETATLRRRFAEDHQELREAIAERVRIGQASAADLALAEASAALAWSRMREAEGSVEADAIELKTLLGFVPDQPLVLRDSLESVIEHLRAIADGQPARPYRPDVRAVMRESEIAELEARKARAEAWNGLRVGIEYARDRAIDMPEGIGETDFVGVKLVVPIPVWSRNQGTVFEKIAVRDALRARADALQRALDHELRAARHEISLHQERLEGLRIRGMVALRARADELRRGFDDGRVDVRDWLAVRSSLAELEMEYVAARASLAGAYARWIGLTGNHPAMQALNVQDDSTPSSKDIP